MSIAAILHVLNHSKVLRAHQTILVRLADHATDSGLSWPSHSLLARETGYTREYVVKVMHALVQQGEVREVFNAKGQRRYQLAVYDTKRQRCSCEQSLLPCELSSQAPKSHCKLSSAGVNSPARKSMPANEDQAEPLQDEPEQPDRYEWEEAWKRDYDALYGR